MDNKGWVRRVAYARFTSCLMKELAHVGGLDTSAKRLDALMTVGWNDGRAGELDEKDFNRYNKYPLRPKARVLSTKKLQILENAVAAILKRPAHTLMLIDNARQKTFPLAARLPKDTEWHHLEVIYEDDWPTWRRLEGSLYETYQWQYGIDWDQEPDLFKMVKQLAIQMTMEMVEASEDGMA